MVKKKLRAKTPLRICSVCGLEAWTYEDLEQFRKAKRSLYGRANKCKPCYNKLQDPDGFYRKGGKHYEATLSRIRRWQKKHPEKVREYNRTSKLKRILFKNKEIILDHNPRTNVCSICGRRYPEGLKQRTAMHHEKYDENHPLKHTIEVCHSCHTKIHMKTREPLDRDEKGRFLSNKCKGTTGGMSNC